MHLGWDLTNRMWVLKGERQRCRVAMWGGNKKLEKMRREHLRIHEEFFHWCSGWKRSVFFFTEFWALLNPFIEVPCAGVTQSPPLQI